MFILVRTYSGEIVEKIIKGVYGSREKAKNMFFSMVRKDSLFLESGQPMIDDEELKAVSSEIPGLPAHSSWEVQEIPSVIPKGTEQAFLLVEEVCEMANPEKNTKRVLLATESQDMAESEFNAAVERCPMFEKDENGEYSPIYSEVDPVSFSAHAWTHDNAEHVYYSVIPAKIEW